MERVSCLAELLACSPANKLALHPPQMRPNRLKRHEQVPDAQHTLVIPLGGEFVLRCFHLVSSLPDAECAAYTWLTWLNYLLVVSTLLAQSLTKSDHRVVDDSCKPAT